MWIRHPSILGRHAFWLNHSVVVSGCGWTVNRKEEQIGFWWRPHNSRNNISLINYILLTSNGTHLLMITKHNIILHYGVWVDTRAGHDVGDEKRWDRILNHNSSTKGNSTNFHQQTQGRMLSFWERGKWNYCHVRRKKEKYHHHWWKGRKDTTYSNKSFEFCFIKWISKFLLLPYSLIGIHPSTHTVLYLLLFWQHPPLSKACGATAAA